MSVLEPLPGSSEAMVYEVRDAPDRGVERFVVTTPESRVLCNRPEIVGVDFTRGLQRAVTRALGTPALGSRLGERPQDHVCVLHLLRGGLSFGLREALYDAYGYTRHPAAFLSSQRFLSGGVWHVREDAYRKLDVPQDAVLFVGDVVATGSTLRHGLRLLREHLEATGTGLRRLVFFTIGCSRLEDDLESFDRHAREQWPAFEGCIAVYIEGRFTLADEAMDLRIALPGTDLLRRDALLAPEFVASQYAAPSHPLERCAIYDAGSRAFDVKEYLADVREYWQEVAALAHDGMTLAEALAERWTMDDSHRWTPPGRFSMDSAAALSAVCEERLSTLERASR